ncbi:MAG: hypothetical protein AB7V55_08390, partial [Oscillospiraceae bacterium]
MTHLKRALASLLAAVLLFSGGGISAYAQAADASASVLEIQEDTSGLEPPASQAENEAAPQPDGSDASALGDDTSEGDAADDAPKQAQDEADAPPPESPVSEAETAPDSPSEPPTEVPGDASAPLPEPEPTPEEADTSEPAAETEAEPDDEPDVPEDEALTLAQLLALALEDGAEAARQLNAIAEEDAFSSALKELLLQYYAAEDEHPQRAAFLQALAGRGTALAQSFAEAAAERAADPFELGYFPGHVLVRFRPMSETQAAEAADELEGTVETVLFEWQNSLITVVDIPLWQTVAQAIESFEADPSVIYAEPNIVITLDEGDATPNDVTDEQWHHTYLETLAAWQLLPTRGANDYVTVAIIDSMPNYDHDDLSGLFLPQHIKTFDTKGAIDTPRA